MMKMMNDKQDLKLMAAELTRLYGKDRAQEIMVQNKDRLFNSKQSVAFALGKRSLKFFSLYYLRDMFYGEDKAALSSTHYEIWDQITEMFQDDESYNKRNHLLSRGFGKTSIINIPTVIYAHCYQYSTFTVLGSAIKDTATSFMMSIREGLKSERIIRTFGDLISSSPEYINNTEKLQLANDSMLMVASTRTTLRGVNYKGNRINLLILDDYMSEENTSSVDSMRKHWNLFQRNALPAVEKSKHWILGFGTTQKKGDFYDRLSKDPTFTTYKKPAIDNIEVFEQPHWQKFKEILLSGDKDANMKARRYYKEHQEEMDFKRVWDYFKCVDLATLYFSDESAFRQEYQLELGMGEKPKFHNIVYTSKNIDSKVLVIDPAVTTDDDADYTAFIVGGHKQDDIVVNYMDYERLEFEDYVSRTLEILKATPDIDTVIIEKQTYNTADVVAIKTAMDRDDELYYRDIEFINEHQSKNKQAKIDSIVGDVNLGRVKFHESLKGSDAIEELRSFISTTSSAHDDIPDALAEFILYIKKDSIMDNTVEVFDSHLLF